MLHLPWASLLVEPCDTFRHLWGNDHIETQHHDIEAFTITLSRVFLVIIFVMGSSLSWLLNYQNMHISGLPVCIIHVAYPWIVLEKTSFETHFTFLVLWSQGRQSPNDTISSRQTHWATEYLQNLSQELPPTTPVNYNFISQTNYSIYIYISVSGGFQADGTPT